MKNLKPILVITFIFLSFLLITNCNNNETETSQQDELALIIEKITKDNVIEINSTKHGNISYLEKDGFEDGFSARMKPGDVLCKGSGISFARCVRKNLDNGKTMKLYKKGKTYYAEEM
ncbi:hypothetical protein [Polaribacter cellanae]|uniref:Uncharacterized protein n=1 Tax=Polaribacter cellanae TaxID=2818493 RepID=A0A975CRW0_9FLAO|nr:hypothetical protein [Polaribacter cellanae]QTE22797.1 hypothetical protein J3359_00510 [Polaribacter cellanae]